MKENNNDTIFMENAKKKVEEMILGEQINNPSPKLKTAIEKGKEI